jgi:hypothetical protein
MCCLTVGVGIVLEARSRSGDEEGLHVGAMVDAFLIAPSDKAARGIQVCLRRVVVVDLAGEELQHALRDLERRSEQRSGMKGRGRGVPTS